MISAGVAGLCRVMPGYAGLPGAGLWPAPGAGRWPAPGAG